MHLLFDLTTFAIMPDQNRFSYIVCNTQPNISPFLGLATEFGYHGWKKNDQIINISGTLLVIVASDSQAASHNSKQMARDSTVTAGNCLQWVRFLSNIGKQRTGSFCSEVRGQVSLALGGFSVFFCCCCFPIFFFYGTIWFRVCQTVGFIELSGNRILSRALNPRHLVRERPRLVSRRLQYLRNPSSQTKALVPPNTHTHKARRVSKTRHPF